MSLTREKIEGMAPDQASLSAALKLMKPAKWPLLAASADGDLLWAECQGSGSTPYRVVVSTSDYGYKCTCPSRKFPCKHALAVLWMRVEKPGDFDEGATPPDWVNEWLSRRRPGTGRPAQKPSSQDGTAPAKSLDAAVAETEAAEVKTSDPKAAARAEAARVRAKQKREEAVLAGLDDLERWIVDQMNTGFGTFAQRADDALRTIAARLVDAKAQGLAARLDTMSADLFRVPERNRPDFLISRLSALAIMASAYRNQDKLSDDLRTHLRRSIGWSVKREELLADQTAPRVASTWIVAATHSEIQPDKLRRLETWLVNAAPVEAAPRVALLLDFVPVAAGSTASPFSEGEVFVGEAVFYHSPTPIRALLANRSDTADTIAWPDGLPGIEAALADYERALAAVPWQMGWPMVVSGVRVVRTADDGLAIADAGPMDDAAATVLPIDKSTQDAALPLLGLQPISVLAQWDGQSLQLMAADTPSGRWHLGEGA